MTKFISVKHKEPKIKDRRTQESDKNSLLAQHSIQKIYNAWLQLHIFKHFNIINNDLDSADPSSMQDACHPWTQLHDLALHEFS